VVGPPSVTKEGTPVVIGTKRVGTVKGVERGAAGGRAIVVVRAAIDKDGLSQVGADTRATVGRDQVVLRPGSPLSRRLESGSVLPATQARAQP
jgi:hypothetical protein